MQNEKTIIRYDCSSLKLSSCGRRFYLDVIGGYKGTKETNDMAYGTAFHKFVEAYYKTGDINGARLKAIDFLAKKLPECLIKENARYLDISHLILTCLKFEVLLKDSLFTSFKPIYIEGQPLIEKKFSIPIYSDESIDVLFQGTIDLIGMWNDVCGVLGDWKTTRARNPQEFFLAFKMSPQLRGYRWALRWLCRQYPDSELTKELQKISKMGAFIYGVFLTTKDTTFERSEIFQFTDAEIDEFEVGMFDAVNKLLVDNKFLIIHNQYPLPEGMINGSCIAPYGGLCKYFGACSSSVNIQGANPREMFELHLNSHFIRKEYKPLEFGGSGE